MRRYPSGLIVFDTIDIICISFSVGSSIAYLSRRHKRTKREDPLVKELKKKSPVMAVSIDGKPLQVPLIRGGAEFEKFKLFSVAIKNKKIAILVRAICTAKKNQKMFRLLQIYFAVLNRALISSVGLGVAANGALDWTQFILIAAPSSVAGFLVGQVFTNPLASVFLPLAILYSRGIENIADPYERCRVVCKVAENFHNEELAMEMGKLNSLVEETSGALSLPLDKVPLLACVEEKLSLLERFKLKQLVKNEKARKRVKHFSDFIKTLPECNVDPEVVYEQVVEKITE